MLSLFSFSEKHMKNWLGSKTRHKNGTTFQFRKLNTITNTLSSSGVSEINIELIIGKGRFFKGQNAISVMIESDSQTKVRLLLKGKEYVAQNHNYVAKHEVSKYYFNSVGDPITEEIENIVYANQNLREYYFQHGFGRREKCAQNLMITKIIEALNLIIDVDPMVEEVKEYIINKTNPQSLVDLCIDFVCKHEKHDPNVLPKEINEKITTRKMSTL